jgi:hypothetical protein
MIIGEKFVYLQAKLTNKIIIDNDEANEIIISTDARPVNGSGPDIVFL